jgi:hypothetical protein
MKYVMEKVAVCVLTRGYKNKFMYSDLVTRNRSIFKNLTKYSREYDIEYIIFHEGNITSDHQEYIQSRTPSILFKFVDVGHEFTNEKQLKSIYTKPTTLSESFSSGYKSMCKFWFDGFLRYTSAYDYIIRIDEDCFLLDFPLRELIQKMKAKDVHYITPSNLKSDHADVTVGLEELANEFLKSNKSLMMDALTLENNPYTNVFLIDGHWYRENKIFRDFCEKVHASNGIFVNRWGDLPLWGVVIKICEKTPAEILDSRIKYIHGSFGEYINKNKTPLDCFHLLYLRLTSRGARLLCKINI